jgi:hypothetical protein
VRAAPGVVLALAAASALGQAPATDRKAAALEFDEAQRKVEFTRMYSIEAAERVRQAELEANETAAARKGADEAAAEARKRDDEAQQALAGARKASAQARAAYQQAAEEF